MHPLWRLCAADSDDEGVRYPRPETLLTASSGRPQTRPKKRARWLRRRNGRLRNRQPCSGDHPLEPIFALERILRQPEKSA